MPDINSALQGTSGTPSDANRYVTDSDSRLPPSGTTAVALQASTPGTPQSGNFNVTGTGVAGAVEIPTLSGDVIGSSGSVEIAIEALDDSQHSEGCSGLGAWAGAGTYYTIVGSGASAYLRLDRPGHGFIRGVRVEWTAPQQTTAFADNTATYVYIDATGTIGTTTTADRALYQDHIVLFEVLDDGTNHVVVRDDHPYEFDNAASHWTHSVVGTVIGRSTTNAASVGADVTRVATGTGGAAGDREVKIVGAARIYDHGIETDIPDSAGAGVTWNVYFTNGSGKWIRHVAQTQLPMVYNNAGTATALTAGRFGIFRLYVSKDDKNSASPTYFAVMHTAEYAAMAQADSAIADGTVSVITNELSALELAQLGFAVVKNSGGGYIDHLLIQKAVVGGGIAGGGAASSAALVTVDTSSFSGALSAADSNVQAALNTLDAGNALQLQTVPVASTAPSTNDVLTYDGAEWIPQAPAAGGLTYWSESENTAAPNATVHVDALAVGKADAEANIDAAVLPKGTGAFLSQIPDGAVAAGNKRGTYAVDFQRVRSLAANVASGAYAAVLSGENNRASSDKAVVVSGTNNTASATHAVVVNGQGNTASGGQSFVGSGATNSASALSTVVAGGELNAASTQYAAVLGGLGGAASGDSSVVLGGRYANTRSIYGRLSFASGRFSATGDAQMGLHVTRRTTTDATATPLTADAGAPSTSNTNVLPNNSAYIVEAHVVARNPATGDAAAWVLQALVTRGANAAATAVVGSVTATTIAASAGAAAWAATLVVNTTRGSIEVQATGVAATTLRWVSSMYTTEVL